MGKYSLDYEKYQALSRKAAAESCVLLKNDNSTLPLRNGDRVAVFGRIAFDYYKSGLGSGGLVNTGYVVGILDALKSFEGITLNEELMSVYSEWLGENPFDEGEGWGRVPWSQKEMPLSDSIVEKAAAASDIAIVLIGRTAGEAQDAANEPGSFLLTKDEKDMLEKVTKAFHRVAVLLNVGNIIDMSWVAKVNPPAILYVWQGGQEGGNGALDVLTGKINPCGRLTDTIANEIKDYPSTGNFGDVIRNYYKEDIYVGYRYFETFAKDKVLYPFGYGLSYTTFQIRVNHFQEDRDQLKINVTVKNTGKLEGKEVVQVYAQAPQGVLGKPSRVLVGFTKTDMIPAGMEQNLLLEIPKINLASYDDSGLTGYKSCFVLEAGQYCIYVGGDVRSAKSAGSYEEKQTVVVERLEEALAPVLSYERIRPEMNINGVTIAGSEQVPLRTINPYTRMLKEKRKEFPYTGDLGYKLKDVFDHNIDLNDFLAQLNNEELSSLVRGEGMCSPKVTPGTAGAFGGVTGRLKEYGIPAACCADGPSGIRMDCGTKAFQVPNGTALGCTFNLSLVEELYQMMGLELRKNKIDTLLGPGLNIHRNPLNGRNFEYISEDPLVTGKMGAAQLKGMGYAGVTGTIKHFCGNDQEAGRYSCDSVISERALREIYLKCFEIALIEGDGYSVMTTYGAVNGIWTSGSYDLCTTILREQWGYDGIVMTDWWATANAEGEKPARENKASMVAAQNDLFMCVTDAQDNMEKDNIKEKLEAGEITRYELARNAANIMNFIMKSPVMLHELNRISEEELEEMKAEDDEFKPDKLVFIEQNGEELVIDGNMLHIKKGRSDVFGVTFHKAGIYELSMELKADLDSLAQLPVSISYDNVLKTVITIQGTEGKWVTESRPFGFVFGKNHYIKFYYGANGLVIDKVRIRFVEEFKLPF